MKRFSFFDPGPGAGGLLRPVLTLVSGTGAALALTYLARPVLTRLFSPEAFGLLGVYVALAAVLATIATGRYEDALMGPEDEADAANVLVLSAGLTLVAALLSTVFILWRADIAALFGQPGLAPYLAWVPLGVFVMSGTRLLETWLTRRNRFSMVSAGRVAQNAVTIPVQLAAGLARTGAGGLIGGLLGGQAAGMVLLTGVALRRDTRLLGATVRWKRLRALAVRYRRFPLYSVPAALLGVGSIQLPALLLFYFFAADVVGFYGQAYGLLAAPISLLGGSVTQVYFLRAAEAHRQGTLGTVTETVFRTLFMLGLYPLAALVLVGPEAFSFVLGESFREAGVYARWLAPWLLFRFASSPLSRLFDVLERQRAFLAFSGLGFALQTAALVTGGLAGDARLALALFGLVGAVLWLGHTLWMLHLGRVSFGAGLAVFGRYLACALLPLAGLAYATTLNFAPGLVVLLTVILGGLYLALATGWDRVAS